MQQKDFIKALLGSANTRVGRNLLGKIMKKIIDIQIVEKKVAHNVPLNSHANILGIKKEDETSTDSCLNIIITSLKEYLHQ